MARLLEFQGKDLLRSVGLPVPRGKSARTADEAASAAEEIGFPVVIKAQVLRGGHGKLGGVRFAENRDEAAAIANDLLANGLGGKTVEQVLVEEKLAIQSEMYLAIATDLALRQPIAIFSLRGGMDIEEVSRQMPQDIVKGHIDILQGFSEYDARNLVRKAPGITSPEVAVGGEALAKLYQAYRKYDCKLVEVNPLVLTPRGICAADARIDIDEDALFRQRDLPLEIGGGRRGPASHTARNLSRDDRQK